MSSGKCRPFCLGFNVLIKQRVRNNCLRHSVLTRYKTHAVVVCAKFVCGQFDTSETGIWLTPLLISSDQRVLKGHRSWSREILQIISRDMRMCLRTVLSTKYVLVLSMFISLQWRHNGRNGVLDHQPHDCFLNRLFRRRSKKTSKPRHWHLWGVFTGDR